jgi:predicted dehydrogenase
VAKSPVHSIAIAGVWGYIGRKFLAAARHLRLDTSVYDPAAPPRDLNLRGVSVLPTEQEFYQQRADLFHLALHPEHRQLGLSLLLPRGAEERFWILCEKPMAAPECPATCVETAQAAERSGAVVLYDFPELFDPLTFRILDYLRQFKEVRIASLSLQRSKDREDPRIARNTKRMVHIQYQESVHCLAFALHLLAHLPGGWDAAWAQGVGIQAHAQPYRPPNSEAYPYVVDGRCDYQLNLGPTRIEGCTDFTRGAAWAKRRVIRGTGDGRPFFIEADYLEGKKKLVISGQPQPDVTRTNSYVEVIRTLSRWRQTHSSAEIMSGPFPNPHFARLAYQLSSALWWSSWEQRPLTLHGLAELQTFDAAFAAAIPHFPRYEQ